MTDLLLATEQNSANPQVLPGKVNWYESLDAAYGASALSGKPVLLFQLLGNLNDEYC